ncbi:protein HESO1 [Lolium perenne]|uniref:protein HESO1 n=1 Tax=Lolium perenne TaxID=4522 RepID=UPI0021F505A7|nr:protein HESO1-like [Lolium perenne]
MIEQAPDNDVLEKCTKDILSLIKPEEDDRNKRQSAIQELEVSIQSAPALSGAAVKPFGSFLSNLYSKSGDLDLSVQLMNGSNLPRTKKQKQTILRQLRKALQKGDVARTMEFIPQARVPVLQYVSNRFGISCDLSVDNYPGRIKSRIFYWVSTLDERFGDMVLLIKEWAKAQNINDPKSGTLNSYSLCLLVLFHFQTCQPAILPPLKDIYEGNITEDFADMTLYDEEHLDEVCAANIAKFQSQNKEQRNESSLCHLLATFFNKFCFIDALSSDVISTYTGKIEKIQDSPNRRMKKSHSLFVEDPVERPDNAARAVGIQGLLLIASALKEANLKFASLEHSDRDGLLAMLCTPAVCSKLGGTVIAKPFTSTPRRTPGPKRQVGAKISGKKNHQGARGFTGSGPVHNPTQVSTDTTGRQMPGQYRNHDPPQVSTDNTTGRQTPGQYRNHDSQFRTNTAGHYSQSPRQPGQYQNHYRPSAYTPGHQTRGLHQNQSYPQAHNAYAHSGVPYQNHNNYQQGYMYTPGHQAAGSYWYPSGSQAHTNRAQTPGQYQYYQPQGYMNGPQTPGPYPNGYQSHPLVHTPEPYQNGYHNQPIYTEGTGVYTADRHTNWNNRNGLTTSSRHEPVAGGLQKGPARDLRSQASSSRTEWQGGSKRHS